MEENNIELPEEQVSFKVKFSFGLGGFANGLLNGFVFANITFFYQNKLGLNAELIAIAWAIFAIWNTVNDPIASYFIDNTRTKIGRRIPFIRYGSFIYGIAFIVCWFPVVPAGNQIGLFINLIAVLFFLDTMYTIVGACFFSLPNEIAVTAKQRASLGVYNAIFGFLNLVIGLVLPILLFTTEEGIPFWFGWTIIIIGGLCAITLFITSFGIKENMFAQLQEHERFFLGLRLTLKNKAFWILMIPGFLISILYPMFNTGLLYYIDYILSGQSLLFFLLGFVIGIVIGLVLNLKLIPRIQPRKTMIYNLLLVAIGFFIVFFVSFNDIILFVPFLIVGIGFSGALVANPVLMGDAIDNDELITGKRREAIYGGVNAIVTKPGLSIANAIFPAIIGAFGFIPPIIVSGNPVKQPQDEIALIGILFAFCIVPSILVVLCAISLRWFPLDGPEWLKKKKYIMELHQEKEQEYLEKLAEENREKPP